MAKSHCNRNYHSKPVDTLDVFALGIKAGIWGNAGTFATPPMTELVFNALIQTYLLTRAAYVQGGLAQKGFFDDAKDALLEGLDELADYVDDVADGLESTITTAGFVPTDVILTPATQPTQPVVTVKRGLAGELLAECAKTPGAKYYGCMMVQGTPAPPGFAISPDGKIIIENSSPTALVLAIDVTQKRKKKFTGLTHDAVYYFYFYAVNAAGVSPFSEVVSMVCW